MRLLKLAKYELVNDFKFSKFAMHLNFVGAILVLALGFRFVGQVATTPIEQLTGLVLLLLLCLALIGLGMVVHLIEIVKAIRDRQGVAGHPGQRTD